MNRKKIAPGLLVLLATLAAPLTARNLHAGAEEPRPEEVQRGNRQVILQTYTSVLKPGMKRPDVERLVKARGATFEQSCCVAKPQKVWADLIKIGEDKAPWYCARNVAYIALEFSATEPQPAMGAWNSDTLATITLDQKLEDCL